MPIIKDVSALQPMTAMKVRNMLKKCEEADLPVVVIETVRTLETQLLYYLQGRLDVKNNKMIANEYNIMRKKFGLWEVPSNDALFKQVTWTFMSNHFDGKAVDIAPLKDGKPWWNAPDEVWNKMGAIGKSCGLHWGGDWPEPKKDKPHFEDI